MPEDFEFPGRAGEGEVGFHPADLERFRLCGGGGGGFARLREDLDDHAFERALEVRGDGLDFLRGVVLGLERVALGVDGRVGVLDGDAVRGDAVHVLHDGCCGARAVLERVCGRPLPQHGALHLVEDGVVAAVDRIAPVYVRDHRVPYLLRAGGLVAVDLLEVRLLVGAGVCPEHRLVVNVVCVRPAAARVVRCESQDIEVLRDRYDGVLLGVVTVYRAGELAFDQFASDCERVVLVEVEPTSDVGQYCVCGVGPLVCTVGLAFNGQ